MSVPLVGSTVTVTASSLNARKSPGSGKVLAVRKKGYTFRVYARKKVGSAWWVRAGTYWYAERYVKMKVYKRVVDTAVLNVRNKPTTKGSKVVGRHKRGYVLKYVAEVKGGGQTWLKSIYGSYYAKEFTRAYKAAPAGGAAAFVKSPVPGYGISTPYGKKPNNRTYWQARGHHTGADYACPNGAKVIAVRDGRIYRRYDSVLGNVQLLYADNGKTYWYCHLSRYSGYNGKKVKAGQVIGYAGSTGSGAMGPHLHFEMRNGHTTSWAGPDRNPTW